MKVGTDAVLLGSWAEMNTCSNEARILEIGSGCGVISLMLAQRYSDASIIGIDIDSASINEANRNAANSPFAHRVNFQKINITDLPKDFPKFNLIVSNPPFYTENTLSPDERRSLARNSHHLTADALFQSIEKHLITEGSVSLVLPTQSRELYVDAALRNGLFVRRECKIRTTQRKQPKRLLIEFSHRMLPYSIKILTLQQSDGTRSPEYSNLCKDFYI